MLSEEMLKLGKKRSVIREIFEYGKIRAKEIGAENIFDFSLGNPNVPPPPCVKETIMELLETLPETILHGYTSAQGDFNVRKTISEYINKTHGVNLTADNIYMTAGAAASLSITLKALTVKGNEVIVFAPFFTEYRVFVEAAGAKLSVVLPDPNNLQIDADNLLKAVNKNTKAVIVNSPNNPSGVVYTEKTIKAVCSILAEKAAEYGHPIYLISDEPYRELVYGVTVPYLMNYYDDTIVCYSYSKSLSLPGERIGYIAVSEKAENGKDVYAAICGAGRALGYVCAPSLFQRVAARCSGKTADIEVYKKNRDILYSALTGYGYACVKPDGAFYLFVKSPEPDAGAFCERAKKYELLLVPGDDFGCPSFVRIAYCVKTETIINSLPAFKSLAEEYKIAPKLY